MAGTVLHGVCPKWRPEKLWESQRSFTRDSLLQTSTIRVVRDAKRSTQQAASYIRGLSELLCADGMCMVVSNMPARHRHLAHFFQIAEVVKLHPEEEPFGPCLYICRRRNSDAEIAASEDDMPPEALCKRKTMLTTDIAAIRLFLVG
eukprot:s4457_g3.t1